MKICIKNLFLLPVLMVSVNLMLAGRVTAQTFTTLHSFTALDPTYFTNSDGSQPQAGLILSGNIFMERRGMAVVWATGRCSPSTPMARVLRTCMFSLAVTMERIQRPV